MVQTFSHAAFVGRGSVAMSVFPVPPLSLVMAIFKHAFVKQF